METEFQFVMTAGDVAIAVMLLVFLFGFWIGVFLYALRGFKQWKQ